jgi:hypothetical protein
MGWWRLLSMQIRTVRPMLDTMMKMYKRSKRKKTGKEYCGVTFNPSRSKTSPLHVWFSIL